MLKSLALLVCLACLAGPARLAATNAQAAADYQAALSDNMKAISAFLADPLGQGLAFAASSQGFTPVEAKPLLYFNLGIGAGVSTTLVDKSGAKAAASQNGTDISASIDSLPASLPIPLGQVNAHLGLPKVLFFESNDIGLRLLGLNVDNADVSVALSGLGVELRGNVFEAGLVSPVTFTLGLGFDSLKTSLHSASKAAAYSTTFGGSNLSGNTQALFDVESQVTSATLKAVVSRKFVFITPYAGLALNVVSGDTEVRFAQKGILTVTGSGPTAYTADTIEGKSSKPVPALEARLGGGLEMSFFFFYLALGGEYGLVSGGSAAHGQVGLQF